MPVSASSPPYSFESGTLNSSPDSSPLPLLYRQTAADDSLLSCDTLMFCRSTQVEGEPWGMKGYAMPDTLHRSDVVSGSLLVSFLLVSLLCLTRRQSLRTIVGNFFFPTLASKEAADEDNKEWQRALVALLFSLQGAIAIIAITQIQCRMSVTLSPWLILGIYTLLLFLFFAFKQCLYRFVHSIFFSKVQRRRWREDYTFLFTVESLLSFPLLLLIVYLHVSLDIALFSALTVLLFVKILLLFKCFSTFFGKLYGILHLFVYFCTLETAPLVVLWTILVELTQGLTYF